jgi:hypothetical protein
VLAVDPVPLDPAGNPLGDAVVAVAAAAGRWPGMLAVSGWELAAVLTLGSLLSPSLRFASVHGDALVFRARDMFADLLPVRERVLGAEHPDAQDARHDLAYWTGHARNLDRARDLTSVLLPIFDRVLGAEHPATQAARDSLDYWTRKGR